MSIRLAVSGARGRMGKQVTDLAAADPRFEIAHLLEGEGHPELGASLTIGSSEREIPLATEWASGADVLVDFSTPSGCKARLLECVRGKVAFVSGTTGLTGKDEDLLIDAASVIPVLHAPNMSFGIEVLCRTVAFMEPLLPEGFDIEVIESHHRGKVDAPSGTAYRIAGVLSATGGGETRTPRFGREGRAGPRGKEEIGVHAVRGGDVIGEHTVLFLGPGERLEITHRCTERSVFARGALHAAAKLATMKPGRYRISDLF
ncbi:MAG: 4-hydroxy-tetrahydrodipicolinate reductase [Planctomycetota bacterium]